MEKQSANRVERLAADAQSITKRPKCIGGRDCSSDDYVLVRQCFFAQSAYPAA
jgi:hypothetical protein